MLRPRLEQRAGVGDEVHAGFPLDEPDGAERAEDAVDVPGVHPAGIGELRQPPSSIDRREQRADDPARLRRERRDAAPLRRGQCGPRRLLGVDAAVRRRRDVDEPRSHQTPSAREVQVAHLLLPSRTVETGRRAFEEHDLDVGLRCPQASQPGRVRHSECSAEAPEAVLRRSHPQECPAARERFDVQIQAALESRR